LRVVGIDERGVDAELRERDRELRVRAAVERARGDDVVAVLASVSSATICAAMPVAAASAARPPSSAATRSSSAATGWDWRCASRRCRTSAG
jgi:hypothetical protein